MTLFGLVLKSMITEKTIKEDSSKNMNSNDTYYNYIAPAPASLYLLCLSIVLNFPRTAAGYINGAGLSLGLVKGGTVPY